MFGLTPVITVFVLMLIFGIIMIVTALLIDGDKHDTLLPICSILGEALFIVSTIVLICAIVPPPKDGFSSQIVIDNDNNSPMRVKYLQHHPYTENEIKTAIVMPDAVKIFKNVMIISKTTNYIDKVEF